MQRASTFAGDLGLGFAAGVGLDIGVALAATRAGALASRRAGALALSAALPVALPVGALGRAGAVAGALASALAGALAGAFADAFAGDRDIGRRAAFALGGHIGGSLDIDLANRRLVLDVELGVGLQTDLQVLLERRCHPIAHRAGVAIEAIEAELLTHANAGALDARLGAQHGLIKSDR